MSLSQTYLGRLRLGGSEPQAAEVRPASSGIPGF
jgi:hypothetical protein